MPGRCCAKPAWKGAAPMGSIWQDIASYLKPVDVERLQRQVDNG